MDDLVTRLRVAHEDLVSLRRGDPSVYSEAADRVEELEGELATWRSVFPDIAPDRVQRDRSVVEKENARLREALRPFASLTVDGRPPNDPETRAQYPWLAKALDDARDALAKAKGETDE